MCNETANIRAFARPDESATAGFVLVGGNSSRMGRDKALLSSNSGLLVQDIAAQVASAAGNVALIGVPERYFELGFDCLPDLRPGLGPLSGIETALESNRGLLNLIVACDMPGLEAPLLLRLLQVARKTGAQCVTVRDGSGAIHPLCAVYHRSCLPRIRFALDTCELRLLDLIAKLQTVTVEIDQKIWNVNTPEEWNSWQRAR